MVALVSRKSPVQVLAQSAVAVAHTGDTNETTLATITVPAGAMGANGSATVEALFSYTNSANAKTLRIRFGGTQMVSIAATTTVSTRLQIRIHNRNATNSQVSVGFSPGFGSSTGPVITAAIDTTAAVNITITGQLASAGETITLESHAAEIRPKA